MIQMALNEGALGFRAVGIVPHVDTVHQVQVAPFEQGVKAEDSAVDAEVEGLLYEALKGFYVNPTTLSDFTSTLENPNGIVSSDKVGPTIARDITRSAFIAIWGGHETGQRSRWRPHQDDERRTRRGSVNGLMVKLVGSTKNRYLCAYEKTAADFRAVPPGKTRRLSKG